METSKTSTGEQSNDLTLFAVDTHVSHSPQQAKEKEQTTHGISGLGSEMPLAHYDQSTQSWRMSEDISLWGEYKSLESLPKSGMTQNGALYQQLEWVRLIDANESSSWPTPRVAGSGEDISLIQQRFRNGLKYNSRLEEAVALWPTPTYGKLAGGTGGMQQIEAKYLAGEITTEERRAMRAGNGGKLNPAWVEWLMGFPLGWTDLED
jgi:hypothetical protein